MAKLRTERLDLRVSPDEKGLISQAASVARVKASEFVRDSVMSRAENILADRMRFDLDDSQWAEFQAALDRPVVNKPNLQRLLSDRSVLEQS